MGAGDTGSPPTPPLSFLQKVSIIQDNQRQSSAIQLCVQAIVGAMNTIRTISAANDRPPASQHMPTCLFHARRKHNLPPYHHISFLQLLIRQQRSRQTICQLSQPQVPTGLSTMTTLTATVVATSSTAVASNTTLDDVEKEPAAVTSAEEKGTPGPIPTTCTSNEAEAARPALVSQYHPCLRKVKSSSIDQPDHRQAQRQPTSAALQHSALASSPCFSPSSTAKRANFSATPPDLTTANANDTMRMASGQSGLVQSHQYPSFASMFQPPSRKEAVRISDEDDGYVYLNQYKLSNQTLGHGTYSIVKLAYNTADNNHYAMKILSKKKLMKKHRLTRKTGDPMQEAYREIAILKKLNHPNIIRLVEVLDDPNDDFLYMAFELLERGEVLSVPTENPLPESTVWSYFRDLLLGVEYLHYNGILHRDLKPSNLLLDDNGRLKIADFGLSHMFEGPDVLLGGTVGTPAFHAPELLSGITSTSSPVSSGPKSHPNSRSGSPVENGRGAFSGTAMDIWSMGITLYSLVYGDVPFRDQFIVGLYNQIRSFPVVFPTDIVVSDEFQDIVLRLLEKDPSKRINVVELREHPWVTRGGSQPLLPLPDENCKVQISVTDEEIRTSVRSIPHLDTLILVKAMLKRASFHHPFKNEDVRKGSLDSNYPYSKTSTAT